MFEDRFGGELFEQKRDLFCGTTAHQTRPCDGKQDLPAKSKTLKKSQQFQIPIKEQEVDFGLSMPFKPQIPGRLKLLHIGTQHCPENSDSMNLQLELLANSNHKSFRTVFQHKSFVEETSGSITWHAITAFLTECIPSSPVAQPQVSVHTQQT
jgi:hypothetical protein